MMQNDSQISMGNRQPVNVAHVTASKKPVKVLMPNCTYTYLLGGVWIDTTKWIKEYPTKNSRNRSEK